MVAIKRKLWAILAIGAIIAIAMNAIAGEKMQGKEKIEAKLSDGNLLIMKNGKIIKNISLDNIALLSKEELKFVTRGEYIVIKGEGDETIDVTLSGKPLLKINISVIKKGINIDLDVPTKEEIEEEKRKYELAVEKAIEIIKNQKEIPIEDAKGKIKGEEIDLWFKSNGSTYHAIINLENEQITLFEKIEEKAEEKEDELLDEMIKIALKNQTIRRLIDGSKYMIYYEGIEGSLGILTLKVLTGEYRIVVDLANKTVKSIETK